MLSGIFRSLFSKSKIDPHHEEDVHMKYLILGIGNVGEKYYGTRHNIGFEVIDYLIDEFNAQVQVEGNAMATSIKHKGRTVFLIKPTTYVNLSGKALRYWMQKTQVPIDNILIIVDDIHLPLGVLRLRQKGSDAGHNGLKDIANILQTSTYPRLKFGIGNDFAQGRQVEYVLGKWKQQEIEKLQELIPRAAEIVLSFVFAGAKNTMDQYNN